MIKEKTITIEGSCSKLVVRECLATGNMEKCFDDLKSILEDMKRHVASGYEIIDGDLSIAIVMKKVIQAEDEGENE